MLSTPYCDNYSPPSAIDRLCRRPKLLHWSVRCLVVTPFLPRSQTPPRLSASSPPCLAYSQFLSALKPAPMPVKSNSHSSQKHSIQFGQLNLHIEIEYIGSTVLEWPSSPHTMIQRTMQSLDHVRHIWTERAHGMPPIF